MRSGLLAAAALTLVCRHEVEDIIEDNPWAVADKDVTGQRLATPKGPTPNRYKPHQGRRETERRARKMKGQQA